MRSHRPIKGIVDFSDNFSRLPTSAIFALWILAAGLAAVAWSNAWVGFISGLFALGDWLMLVNLPRLQRSYGPPQLPWLALTGLRFGLVLVAALLPSPWEWVFVVVVQLAISVLAAYAFWVEPAQLAVTRINLRSPRFNGCPPLRLLQISDLHVERITDRERRLVTLVRELAPDVIVVTGDYLNISYTWDETAQRQAREILSQLQAPGGVYAITGSPSVDSPEVLSRLLGGLEIAWLRDQLTALNWHGCSLQIVGVECSDDIEVDAAKLLGVLDGRADDAFTLLLYHTPDVMPVAVRAGVDLYLAGHTHGGQLRLPFYGALVTASFHGKRYEMGLYDEESTSLYVSRGVGMEGKGAPRARFLCPPEIVLFTLMGADGC